MMRWHLKSWPALVLPLPALIVPLPATKFPNKLASKAPNNTLRNPPFSCYASFLIVLLTRFINKQDSSSDLTIFMIPFISSFQIINFVNMIQTFLMNSVSAAAVNPNEVKTLLANGLSTFPIKRNPFFSNGPKSLPKNYLDCSILCN